MDGMFASGRIIDLILFGVLAEAVLLFALCRRMSRFAPFAATLLSGAALMLALRAALIASPWPVVAGWMLLGLVAHAGDLLLRRKALHGDAWPQGSEKRDRNNGSHAAFTRR
jgi:hypothetical protein